MANQLDNLKVGDLVKNKNDGITWRVTAIAAFGGSTRC